MESVDTKMVTETREETIAPVTVVEQVNTSIVEPVNGVPANDKLILHQFPRIPLGPSASVFALKLETYVRLCKMAYENDFSRPQSSKGKTPWITFEGKEIADSSLCIDYLKTRTGIDLNSGLSPAEKGISRAFQKLIEEELYWVVQMWRWMFDKEESLAKTMGSGKVKTFFVTKYIRNKIRKDTHAHGLGRHSVPEIMKIGQDDLAAVGDFLGQKKYFMGDQMTDIDCTVFGLLAQLLYITPNCPLTSFIRENHANLIEYCDRVRGEVWPDWEEICLTATKPEKESKKTHKTVMTSESIVTNGNGTTGNGKEGMVNGYHAETFPITNGTGNLHREPADHVGNGNGEPMASCTVAQHITHNGDGNVTETKEVRYESSVTAPMDGTPGAVEVVIHKEVNGMSHTETEAVPAS